ncbi:MAG TPA: permease [Lachnospiraceae bacterium]|nr:permease [Lachnospiraceae bacterium]
MKILQTIGLFLQNQILGMKWLNELITGVLTSLGLDTATWYGGAIAFFIYDTIKIFILLSVLIFLISYIQSFFPPARAKRILGRFHGIGANTIAALLGTVTPFCSCSSIPIFIGFTGAGLPLGVTFSFLISSPLVDLGSLVLLTGIFGWKIAFAYVIVGLFLAIVVGTLIEKLNMEKYIEDFSDNESCICSEGSTPGTKERLQYAKERVVATVKKVAPYILIGVGIGALIHNMIPAEFVEKVLGSHNPFSVLVATLLSVPMYADIFGTIPIAEALLAKGAGLGTILSFMMGVTALSLPSMIMLRKAVKPKLLGIFVGAVVIGIIIIGYLFNAIQFLFI